MNVRVIIVQVKWLRTTNQSCQNYRRNSAVTGTQLEYTHSLPALGGEKKKREKKIFIFKYKYFFSSI